MHDLTGISEHRAVSRATNLLGDNPDTQRFRINCSALFRRRSASRKRGWAPHAATRVRVHNARRVPARRCRGRPPYPDQRPFSIVDGGSGTVLVKRMVLTLDNR
ncbi:hypothetical protein GCM10022254_07190 [Actinomadura meridiana]|uniref:Uncharacterized protein n=1 Tax=Actinomadura meridiana TaxID=559626 RepID=A0ABP8BTB9_9ACTN